MLIPGLVKNTNPEMIKTIIQELTGVKIDEKTRCRDVVEARQIAMFMMRKQTNLSLARIGMLCGNRDHATVLHAERTVTNLLETNKEFNRQYAQIFDFFNYSINTQSNETPIH